MSLLEDIEALSTRAKDVGCGVCAWVRSQDAEIRTALDAYADLPKSSISALYRVCVKNGLERSHTQFKVHMREHRGQQ